MTTAAVTNTFTGGTNAVPSQVNTNFNDLVSFLNTNVIQKDGSTAMTAGLTLSGDPTSALHAATKQYVDATHARAVSRLMAADNAYVDQVTYAALPNAADAAALTVSFTKARADTRLVMTLWATFQNDAGIAQLIYVGLRQGATTTDVAKGVVGLAVVRDRIWGAAEVTGLAAGTYSYQPVFKSATALQGRFYGGYDVISYTIQEVL